ncbi:transcriptional regulator [Methylotenera oryzisoli]|uniref:Transcriptional regulator n=1 Tax=Methylotenera oryzisoli TaxID=2080758 RepID=A0A4Y9VTI9_9PROT|nr:XRE family transcriptional regulator [Methylotenera oryzisoli]TFW72330.1 transcriptional regulator [Methylotenera oryzisoli]
MIGERLKRARSAAGFSMDVLGTAVGISANMIKKYEHDLSMPSSGVLLKLAAALNVRTEYFFRPAKVKLAEVEYRKKANASAYIIKKIEADVLDQAERWHELANLWPQFPIPPFLFDAELPNISCLDDIDEVVDCVRSHWNLGLNPLPNMIDLLESKGVLVIITQTDVKNTFDGLQAHIGNQPVIVVSADWPGCRQRFTLAHELGHLIMHGHLPVGMDEEKACNRFASAFLLPKSGIVEHLGKTRKNIEPRELFILKHEYGLSMAGCLFRASDLGIISDQKRVSMFKLFTMRGWRTQEPGEPYRAETTCLFEQLVYRALGEQIISESKAAELLQMPLIQLHRSRVMSEMAA